MGAAAAIGASLVGTAVGAVQSNKAADQAQGNYNTGQVQTINAYNDAFAQYDTGIDTYKQGMDASAGQWDQAHTSFMDTTNKGIDAFNESSGKAIGAANANLSAARGMAGQMLAAGSQARADAQAQLDAWEGTFGGIQDNLSEYYKGLDPVKFATQNKVSLQEHMDKQMTQMNESMAAAGVQTAGMKQQAQKESAFELAKGNAAIDIAAPEQVAQMQQGFVNSGSGQLQGAMGMMNSANNLSGSMASAAGSLMNSAGQGVTAAYGAQASGLANLYGAQASGASNLYASQAKDTANMYGNLAQLQTGKGNLQADYGNAMSGLSSQQADRDMQSSAGWANLGGSALGAGIGVMADNW